MVFGRLGSYEVSQSRIRRCSVAEGGGQEMTFLVVLALVVFALVLSGTYFGERRK